MARIQVTGVGMTLSVRKSPSGGRTDGLVELMMLKSGQKVGRFGFAGTFAGCG
ncbi:MAG: hypothetical protein R3C49_21475 [Planctomycetaceae bacterium]